MIEVVLETTEFHALKGMVPLYKSILFRNPSLSDSIYIHPISLSPMFEGKLAEDSTYGVTVGGFTILEGQAREIHVRPSDVSEYGVFEFEINFDYDEGSFLLDENNEAILDEDGYPILLP